MGETVPRWQTRSEGCVTSPGRRSLTSPFKASLNRQGKRRLRYEVQSLLVAVETHKTVLFSKWLDYRHLGVGPLATTVSIRQEIPGK